MKFTLNVTPGEKSVLVKVVGRIGGEASIRMYQEIKGYMDSYPKMDFVLDFSGVDFIDSSGLGALVAVNSALLKQERALALTSLPENLAGLLKMTNLDKVLRVLKSADEIR